MENVSNTTYIYSLN